MKKTLIYLMSFAVMLMLFGCSTVPKETDDEYPETAAENFENSDESLNLQAETDDQTEQTAEENTSVKDADRDYYTENDSDSSSLSEISVREDSDYWYYRVGSFRGSGDCLASIARKYYGDTAKWHKIYNANRDIISNPNRIKQGLVIRIPKN